MENDFTILECNASANENSLLNIDGNMKESTNINHKSLNCYGSYNGHSTEKIKKSSYKTIFECSDNVENVPDFAVREKTSQEIETFEVLSVEPDNLSSNLNYPPDLDEIFSTDEKKIKATAHNVSILNAACQKILKEMERSLLISLKKNRKEQEIILTYLGSNENSKLFEISKKSYLRCIGIPYFKDPNGYLPPLNKDVLHKKKQDKLLPIDFLVHMPIWSAKDSKTLSQAVTDCKNSMENKNSDKIDWLKISATNMDGKYSPSECKSMWLMNLCPEVNKSPWSKKELKQLNMVAEKHESQNWDKISEELGTNRTGFQCCVQFQTYKFHNEKWTKKEDEKLLQYVRQFKIKDHIPWPKIAWHFEDRSLRQCEERYLYHLQSMKKGSFTLKEDYVLLYLYSKLKSFKEVAKYFPKRVVPQIRARYEYLVKTTMPDFTEEEDALLIQLMAKYPRNWNKISEHFKDRSKLQCRKRWIDLQKKISLDKDASSGSETDEDEREDEPKEILTTESDSKIDKHFIETKFINNKLEENEFCIQRKSKREISKEYSQLLEYCKNGYQFLFGPKPRIPHDSKEKDKLTAKMNVAMKTLNVNFVDPLWSFDIDSLKNYCEFDGEDLAVLNALKSYQTEEGEFPSSSGHQIVPPNYITLIGMRSLLVNAANIKSWAHHYKNPSESNSIDARERDRILFCDAKRLFQTRMRRVFAFPLIMSGISQDGTHLFHLPGKKTKRPKPLSKRAKKLRGKKIRACRVTKLPQLKSEPSGSEKTDGEVEKVGDDVGKGDPLRKKKRGRKRKRQPVEEEICNGKTIKLE